MNSLPGNDCFVYKTVCVDEPEVRQREKSKSKRDRLGLLSCLRPRPEPPLLGRHPRAGHFDEPHAPWRNERIDCHELRSLLH